ncbi:MAG: PQQ-dependent sugar dehydrogenase [Proteobacteria bacterium]|nr:PQQ-dependent sugar dehydrogenase [Pseudomonadota bacterium]
MRRIISKSLRAIVGGSLAACGLSLLLSSNAWSSADYKLETVTDGLNHPWSVAFLPNGEFLVTELGGKLLRLSADGSKKTIIGGVPDTYVAQQGGFFDIVLHPDFKSNKQVYLSYAHGGPDANGTGIIRATLGKERLENTELIMLVATVKDTPVHYGGRMLFRPDGTLLVTTGDGFEYREKAQDLSTELGKVLRINPNGVAAADNPFPDRGSPRVWTYGHRNPQGLALNSDTGEIYLHEHGAKGGDELNILQAGKNYGWPAITLGVDYSGAHVTPFKELPGMEQPAWFWVPSIAPSGLAWYGGTAFPQWHGDLFVGALVNKDVRRLDLEDGKVVGEEILFGEIGERIRDVRSGPDGYLYLLTDSKDGKLIRVKPDE